MPGLLPVVVVLESSQACPTLTEAVAFGLPAWAICCCKSLSSGTLKTNCVVLIFLCHLNSSTRICFLLATCHLDSAGQLSSGLQH